MERDTAVKRLIERESALIGRVQELEDDWKAGVDNLIPRAEKLLADLGALSDDVGAVFLEAPVTSLHDAKFGWASYEIANARLNVTSLLMFGVNAVAAKRAGLMPEARDQIPAFYVLALLSDEAKEAVEARLAKPDSRFSSRDFAGLVINAARDAADELLKKEARA